MIVLTCLKVVVAISFLQRNVCFKAGLERRRSRFHRYRQSVTISISMIKPDRLELIHTKRFYVKCSFLVTSSSPNALLWIYDPISSTWPFASRLMWRFYCSFQVSMFTSESGCAFHVTLIFENVLQQSDLDGEINSLNSVLNNQKESNIFLLGILKHHRLRCYTKCRNLILIECIDSHQLTSVIKFTARRHLTRASLAKVLSV